MTCTENFGKFKCTLEREALFCVRKLEVEMDVTWVSCGVYQLEYWRPHEAPDADDGILVREEWYPPSTLICFTPEQFDKAYELYPSAPQRERAECYKPYYEDYDLDRGMFDMGYDNLFQAYKDPLKEKVYLVKRHFIRGNPSETSSVLGLYFDDFKRLKELLDSKKHLIFYSGCYMSGSPFFGDEKEQDEL